MSDIVTLQNVGSVRETQYTNSGLLERDVRSVKVEDIDPSLKNPEVRKAWCSEQERFQSLDREIYPRSQEESDKVYGAIG